MKDKPGTKAKLARSTESRDQGEQEFEFLFAQFHRSVNYFFANRGFSAEECRDLTQETFLGVYRGIRRFRRDSSVETWLFKIAANVWKNAIRSRSAVKRDGFEIPIDETQNPPRYSSRIQARESEIDRDPLDRTLEDERAQILRTAINELPAQMRRCLILRIDQDLKYREIAAVMQISIETVKSQLFQARDRLKKRLAGYFEGFDF